MSEKKPSLQQAAEEYVNGKYDDSFTYLGMSGSHPGTDNHQIFFRSSGYPDDHVVVYSTETKDSYSFSDNYLSVKFHGRTVSMISEGLTSLFSDAFFLVYTVPTYSTSKNVADYDSFEQYIADETSCIEFTAIVSMAVADRADVEKKLERWVKEGNMKITGTVYFTTDRSDFSDLNDSNYYTDYLARKTYDSRLYFTYVEDGSYKFNWR